MRLSIDIDEETDEGGQNLVLAPSLEMYLIVIRAGICIRNIPAVSMSADLVYMLSLMIYCVKVVIFSHHTPQPPALPAQ